MTTALLRAAARLCERISCLSRELGQETVPDPAGCLDRSDVISLAEPGIVSPNGSCRLFRAADGWVALNLPRPDDWELLPALFRGEVSAPGWEEAGRCIARTDCAGLVRGAAELGLALSCVAEISCLDPLPPKPAGKRTRPAGRLTGLDLSTLWAGPLCAGLLASSGVGMVRVVNTARPDPHAALPALDRRLNGAKHLIHADLSQAAGQAEVTEAIAHSDILITSARPRALDQFGWSQERLRALNPDLIHVAITGYGWNGLAGQRAGFGDDAAAAGGLVAYGPDGAPSFLGDALADPLTGLAACAGALEGLLAGRAGLVDAALARTAAGIRSWMGTA